MFFLFFLLLGSLPALPSSLLKWQTMLSGENGGSRRSSHWRKGKRATFCLVGQYPEMVHGSARGGHALLHPLSSFLTYAYESSARQELIDFGGCHTSVRSYRVGSSSYWRPLKQAKLKPKLRQI